MEVRIERFIRQPAVLLVVGGLVLLAFSAWLWLAKVQTGTHTVFDGMLERNLATSAVTVRQQTKEQGGITIDKRSEIEYGARKQVRIKTTSTAKATKSSVQTETIANKDKEFNRYTSINVGEGGQPVDTKAVLNKWAEGAAGSTAYVQTLLRPYVLPMADLNGPDRERLVQYLRDNEVFQTDYAVQRSKQDGRRTYTYNVNIQPVAYIAFLKGYAKQLGLKDLDEVDPQAAQGSPAVTIKLTVDVQSRRLVVAEYPAQGFSERYGDYDVARTTALPKAQISAEQLQALIPRQQ